MHMTLWWHHPWCPSVRIYNQRMEGRIVMEFDMVIPFNVLQWAIPTWRMLKVVLWEDDDLSWRHYTLCCHLLMTLWTIDDAIYQWSHELYTPFRPSICLRRPPAIYQYLCELLVLSCFDNDTNYSYSSLSVAWLPDHVLNYVATVTSEESPICWRDWIIEHT